MSRDASWHSIARNEVVLWLLGFPIIGLSCHLGIMIQEARQAQNMGIGF